ncbi:Mitochondrial ribosomal protein l37 [Thalictrum thalictroides]|uniref:Large ribosomal subunit protein mL54 n=1 Tax=Thalictrum thalictroides TaxID=46969 RepID=A0A7J6W639_THATH|nr:Mitochondrial ribosomal protein l37 [Thalictrum thalictroides]
MKKIYITFLVAYVDLAFHCGRTLRTIHVTKDVALVMGCRSFSAGSKAKKGSKGGAASDAPKASILSKETKSSTVVGANILKDGTDSKIMEDSEYPDWLWHLLDKKPPLSELRRKNTETLPYEHLKRFVKLDNCARIKENNADKAKN